jgi:protein tyrosine/serine phosphatase
MRIVSRNCRAYAAAIILAFSVCSFAEAPRREKLAKIQIKNFGYVNDNYFRGAQPQARDYPDLAGLGIKTVLDLQRGGEAEEQKLVEAAGMKFYRIGMSSQSRPNREQVEAFLKIINDPANQPVFVHCAGGRHRTGVMTAIYRMTKEAWNADKSFAEMKQYQFNKGLGHGALKDFVYEYYTGLNNQKLADNGHGVKGAVPNR